MSVFIAEVVPDSGPDSGGNTVTISGCGLADVAAVSFGDVAATSFTVDSDNAVTAVAPAGTGSVPVTVTADTAVSDSVVYTYIGSPTAAPVVAAIAPQAGDPAGGSDIIAVGSGFTGATAATTTQ